MKDYQLSAYALLYAVSLSGAKGIAGVPNVYGVLNDSERSRVVETAKQELEKEGLLTMDFDGNQKADDAFLAIVRACGGAKQISGYDHKSPDGSTESYTVFATEKDNLYLLTSHGMADGKIRLVQKDREEIIAFVKEELHLPEKGTQMKSAVIETKYLTEPEIGTLKSQGCDEQTAALICSAINGGAHALTMRRVTDGVENLTHVLIWDDKSVMKMHVVYEDDLENMYFDPVDDDAAVEMLKEVTERI